MPGPIDYSKWDKLEVSDSENERPRWEDPTRDLPMPDFSVLDNLDNENDPDIPGVKKVELDDDIEMFDIIQNNIDSVEAEVRQVEDSLYQDFVEKRPFPSKENILERMLLFTQQTSSDKGKKNDDENSVATNKPLESAFRTMNLLPKDAISFSTPEAQREFEAKVPELLEYDLLKILYDVGIDSRREKRLEIREAGKKLNTKGGEQLMKFHFHLLQWIIHSFFPNGLSNKTNDDSTASSSDPANNNVPIWSLPTAVTGCWMGIGDWNEGTHPPEQGDLPD